MANQVGTSQVIRFATFEVDLQAQELRKAGLRLKLTGQPFQVLAILLEKPGTVVTREELQKQLWPDTFVDVDHNLNTAINKIREALGDSADNPRFVETLARRGYRFIAPVESMGAPGQVSPAGQTGVKERVQEEPNLGFVSPPKSERRPGRLPLIGVLLTALVVIGLVLWLW